MSPWIAGFLLLTAGPMVASLYFAFTDYNLFNSPKWVGLGHFTRTFDDPRWQKPVEVTAKFVIIALALGVAPGGWVGNADWVLYCLVALTVCSSARPWSSSWPG